MENRSNNCKNQSQNKTTNQTNEQTNNRTANRTTNSAANEHKHPNQYTKGADDEGAKNSTRIPGFTPSSGAADAAEGSCE